MQDLRKVCPQCNKTFHDNNELEILTECPDDGSVLAFDAIDPLIGTVLGGRYNVTALIGRGATSTVYSAIDEQLNSNKNGDGASKHVANVAIKVLHPHLSGDAAVVKRLSQEAKSLREFAHANVVSVSTMGATQHGQPYFVMEHLRGTSLLDHFRKNGALRGDMCLSVFDQILDAIGSAHIKGILHRDLKPGNIMLVDINGEEEFEPTFPTVKLLDFGIAKIIPMQGDTFFRLTQTGEMMGSLLYMSPEQCMEQDWDQRSDLYSLGCVFYEALTAQVPLVGRTAFETMNKHLSEMPQPPSVVRPDLSFSPGLEYIVMKLLEKDPAARYQNAEEVRIDLNLVRGGKGANLPALNMAQFPSGSSARNSTGISMGNSTGISTKSQTPGNSLDPYRQQQIQSMKRRTVEFTLFVLLMIIWSIPLVLAFNATANATANALIAGCLFGVLLPILAAVSSVFVVRLWRIGRDPVEKVGVLNNDAGGLLSSAGSISGARLLLPHFSTAGTLFLGHRAGFIKTMFGVSSRKAIEASKRAQSLPLLIMGKEGTGKTSLLASLATNNLEDKKRAQIIFSPDGELADSVLRWIAAHPQGKRLSERVLIIDLTAETGIKPAEQNPLSIREAVKEKKIIVLKGARQLDCRSAFRWIFQTIFNEARSGARCFDTEKYPSFFVDDFEKCGIADDLIDEMGPTVELGVEIFLSAKTLTHLSMEQRAHLITNLGGLALFSVDFEDAASMWSVFSSSNTTPYGILGNIDKNISPLSQIADLRDRRKSLTTGLTKMPDMHFQYLSRVANAKPARLIAPYFPSIRTTEVEWSIIESMKHSSFFKA